MAASEPPAGSACSGSYKAVEEGTRHLDARRCLAPETSRTPTTGSRATSLPADFVGEHCPHVPRREVARVHLHRQPLHHVRRGTRTPPTRRSRWHPGPLGTTQRLGAPLRRLQVPRRTRSGTLVARRALYLSRPMKLPLLALQGLLDDRSASALSAPRPGRRPLPISTMNFSSSCYLRPYGTHCAHAACSSFSSPRRSRDFRERRNDGSRRHFLQKYRDIIDGISSP